MNRTTLHRIGAVAIALAVNSASALLPNTLWADENEEHCDAIRASVEDAGFANDVIIACADTEVVLSSDTYPDHTLMTGIVATNEQIPVPAKRYAAPIPTQPIMGTSPQTRDAALGVAVNGVPIFDYTGGGEMSQQDLLHHQVRHDTLLTQQLDVCGGHTGRGDDYHYHVKPNCMIEQMENAGDDAIIGWAFDGFPIFGDNNPDGTSIEADTLDVCNGQPDDTYGYRYHTSTEAPYIIQCLMGEVASIKDLPRTPPLSPQAGGRGKAAGRPPAGGVNNLTFTQNASGLRSMDYSYEGQKYYIRYSPASTPDCYEFQSRTITDNGEVTSGVYCR